MSARAEVAADGTRHTLSSVRLKFFLSLTADVVVVGTDVVSCLLLSINAGRRFFSSFSATAAGGCGDGCFLIFRTSSRVVPKRRCRKCVLSCFVITFSRVPQYFFP